MAKRTRRHKKATIPLGNHKIGVNRAEETADNQLVASTWNDLKKTLLLVFFLFTLEIIIFYANLRGIV